MFFWILHIQGHFPMVGLLLCWHTASVQMDVKGVLLRLFSNWTSVPEGKWQPSKSWDCPFPLGSYLHSRTLVNFLLNLKHFSHGIVCSSNDESFCLGCIAFISFEECFPVLTLSLHEILWDLLFHLWYILWYHVLVGISCVSLWGAGILAGQAWWNPFWII